MIFCFACSMANIPACYLGTAQTKSNEVIDGILNREYRIVYITPEYATNSAGFIKTLAEKIGKFNCVLCLLNVMLPVVDTLGEGLGLLPMLLRTKICCLKTIEINNDFH